MDHLFKVRKLVFKPSTLHWESNTVTTNLSSSYPLIPRPFTEPKLRPFETYDELSYEQLVYGLPDLSLGLHLQFVVLPPGRLRNPQLQLRLVAKTWDGRRRTLLNK